MKFSILTAFFILLLASSVLTSKAQNYTVNGTVVDSAGLPLPGALVRINWGTDSTGNASNMDGSFQLSQVKSRAFMLSVAYIGFKTFVKQYNFEQGNVFDLADLTLQIDSNTLDAVVISGVPPVRVTEDTVSFNASSFPVREGDAVEEILKKLPGIEVDKDGNVTSEGKPITKIRINGKDFFGTDVATAIRNLPADIIENLQFIDDYGDQANLTGLKTGEPQKVLNLTIQEEKKKGYFARASAGLGNADRYNTSFRGNSMKGERDLNVDGTLNNANNRGRGGDGLTTRNAAGFNYRNEWSEKFSANAWYNFEDVSNNTVSTALTQNFLQNTDGEFTRLENSNNDNDNTRNHHRFGGNIEYKADSMRFLKISPEFSYNRSHNQSQGVSTITQEDLLTNRTSNNSSRDNSLNLKTNIFYNHKFSRKGRNFSAWGSINYNDGNNSNQVYNDYRITDSGLDSSRIQNQ